MKQVLSVAMLMIFFIGFAVSAQTDDDDKSSNEPSSKISLLELIQSTTDNYVITHEHVSSISQVRNVYLRQAINGIGIYGTESSIHISPLGVKIAEHNKFLADVNNKLESNSQSLTAVQAVQRVAAQMGYGTPSLQVMKTAEGANQKTLFNEGGISMESIPVQLMYYYQKDDGIRLSWNLSIAELDGTNWYNFM
ncbi:MAG: hypothetical protein HKN66_10285, partial [Flavobacteriaceae bacterium]|nr:hypothetical protein [Flavobacteriaceae bacterium]